MHTFHCLEIDVLMDMTADTMSFHTTALFNAFVNSFETRRLVYGLSALLDYQGDVVQSSLHFLISHLIFEMEITSSGRNVKLEVIKKAQGWKGGTSRLLFEFCHIFSQ